MKNVVEGGGNVSSTWMEIAVKPAGEIRTRGCPEGLDRNAEMLT